MRAFVTGQVGVDKGPYLDQVKAVAQAKGQSLEVCHVGRMMRKVMKSESPINTWLGGSC